MLTPTVHRDRVAADIDELGRDRWIEHARRERRRQRARPGRNFGSDRKRELHLTRLTPRNEADLFGRGPPALHDRGGDRVVAEHPLDPCERTIGPLVRDLVATPEPELAPVGRYDLVGNQREAGDTRSGLPGVDPRVELPPHPFREHTRRERVAELRTGVPPTAREPFAVLRLRLDEHARARKSALGEPFEQPVGQLLRRERGDVDPFRGRIELGAFDEIRRRRDEHRRTGIDAPRELVNPAALTAEAGEHGIGRERGDRAECGQTEADEEAREVVVVEHRHRPRRDVLRRPARGNHHRTPCREPGDEHPVGDTDAHVVAVGTEHGDNSFTDLRRERVVAPEVARRTPGGELTTAGPFEHDARSEFLDRARHDFERARLVRLVGVDAHRFGAPRLRLHGAAYRASPRPRARPRTRTARCRGSPRVRARSAAGRVGRCRRWCPRAGAPR